MMGNTNTHLWSMRLLRTVFLMLLGACFSLHAVIEVAYEPSTGQQVREIDDDGEEQEFTAQGSSFITSSRYALIVNPNDAADYSGVVYSNDKAYRIMTYLFGTMNSSPYAGIICAEPNPCSALMGSLFAIFNSGLLVIGTVFLAYTIINSSFSDAAQGTSLGQKFAPQEVALRCAVGLSFLLPTSSGYSIIQIAIVRLVLLGSSAGTGLWHYLVDYRFAANEPLGSGHLYDEKAMSSLGGNSAAQEFIQDMGDLYTCVYHENYHTTVEDNFLVVEPYTDSTGTTYIQTGSPADGFNNKCGEMNLGQLSDAEYSIVLEYMNQVQAVASSMTTEYFANNNTLLDVDIYQNQYFIIKDLMRLDLSLNTIEEEKLKDLENDGDLDDRAADSEWLDVPGYFFKYLTSPNNKAKVKLSTSMSEKPTMGFTSSDLHNYYEQATDFSQQEDQNSGTNMGIKFAGETGATYEVRRNLEDMFSSVDKFEDPLIGLAAYGRAWLDAAMGVLIAAFTLGILIASVTGLASDYLSISQMGIGMAFIGILTAVLQAFGAIIPIASVFAIGLPMTPLIIYTSAIVSWIIYTIAGVLSGPIIAIGLISPGEGLGKAAPALILLLNLFMRPCLHVIGLVAGAKLFNIAYVYFTQAFITTVYAIFEVAAPDNTTLMSLTSIIFLYAYTFAIAALCNRCYSLIFLIPDRVFTWIGAPPMQLPDNTVQATRTALQHSADSATQTADNIMKGIDEAIKDRTDTARSKIGKREQAGEEARSLRDDLGNVRDNLGRGAGVLGTGLTNWAGGVVNSVRETLNRNIGAAPDGPAGRFPAERSESYVRDGAERYSESATTFTLDTSKAEEQSARLMAVTASEESEITRAGVSRDRIDTDSFEGSDVSRPLETVFEDEEMREEVYGTYSASDHGSLGSISEEFEDDATFLSSIGDHQPEGPGILQRSNAVSDIDIAESSTTMQLSDGVHGSVDAASAVERATGGTDNIVGSYISRNYNRGMSRLVGGGEALMAVGAGVAALAGFRGNTSGEEGSKPSYSQQYREKAQKAEKEFKSKDLDKASYLQKMLLSGSEQAFNLLGSWKSLGSVSWKSSGPDNELSAVVKMGEDHPAMRSDYRATYQFHGDPRKQKGWISNLREPSPERAEILKKRKEEKAQSKGAQRAVKRTQALDGDADNADLGHNKLEQRVQAMEKRLADGETVARPEVSSIGFAGQALAMTGAAAALSTVWGLKSTYEKVKQWGASFVDSDDLSYSSVSSSASSSDDDSESRSTPSAGSQSRAVGSASSEGGSDSDSTASEGSDKPSRLDKLVKTAFDATQYYGSAVLGDWKTWGESLSVRAQAFSGYVKHSAISLASSNSDYHKAVADKYQDIGTRARKNNQEVQPKLTTDHHQVEIRRELRTQRKEVASVRQNLSESGKRESEIRQDPTYKEALAQLKKTENKLDRGNVIVAGLRMADRGVKSLTKQIGEGSRLGLKDSIEKYKSSNWSDGYARKAAHGALNVGWAATDLTARAATLALVKAPGALFLRGTQGDTMMSRKSGGKKGPVSDRQIFAFEAVSGSDDQRSLWSGAKNLGESGTYFAETLGVLPAARLVSKGMQGLRGQKSSSTIASTQIPGPPQVAQGLGKTITDITEPPDITINAQPQKASKAPSISSISEEEAPLSLGNEKALGSIPEEDEDEDDFEETGATDVEASADASDMKELIGGGEATRTPADVDDDASSLEESRVSGFSPPTGIGLDSAIDELKRTGSEREILDADVEQSELRSVTSSNGLVDGETGSLILAPLPPSENRYDLSDASAGYQQIFDSTVPSSGYDHLYPPPPPEDESS